MNYRLATVGLAALLFVAPAFGQFFETATPPPPSLKELDLPDVHERVADLPLVDASAEGAGGYIKDEQAAILLGKMLYWDMQLGSKRVACATCHYRFGADAREKNQLNPGTEGGNGVFDPTNLGGHGPNRLMLAGDWPFHQVWDPANRDSTVLFDTDDVMSSAGTPQAVFNDIVLGDHIDDCDGSPPDVDGFKKYGLNLRKVEPRNTPTVINAAFFDRQFWDGRASNIFNGVDPTGMRNADARVLERQGSSYVPIRVEFVNASLASQVTGPPVSDFEMSCLGRTWPKIGKKMLNLDPLNLQTVHANDSVLGPISNIPANGVSITYQQAIEDAFANRFWNSFVLFDADMNQVGFGVPANTNQYTLAEINFSLFAGLAIMMYERTLISDNTPYDQWAEDPGNEGREVAESNTRGILTAAQMRGMELFFTNSVTERANCATCHQGPTFTTAAFPFSEPESGEFPEKEQAIERMRMGNGVDITENLFAYFVEGDGSFAGGSMSAYAGAFTIPTVAPAGVDGNLNYSGIACNNFDVESFLLDQDQNPNTIDATFTAACEDGCHNGEEVTVSIVDGGPGADTITVDDGNTVVSGPLTSGDFKINMSALYDTGFYNIGVRPISEDPGVGADDANGVPLSFTNQWRDELLSAGSPRVDSFTFNPARFDVPFFYGGDSTPPPPFVPGGAAQYVGGDAAWFPAGLDGPEWVQAAFGTFPLFLGLENGRGREAVPAVDPANDTAILNMQTAVDGAFKTSGLRNVELTGPYFHNGGQLTLDQVLEFYNRGADFAIENLGDLSPNIHPLNLDDQQRSDIVEFLKALTDEDVRCERAPFDHPGIILPEGHGQNGDGTGMAVDQVDVISHVGANGKFWECEGPFLQ